MDGGDHLGELGLQGEFNTEDAEDTEHTSEKKAKITGLKDRPLQEGPLSQQAQA